MDPITECQDCKFAHPNPARSGRLECRVRAPVAVKGELAMWPRILKHRSPCGDYVKAGDEPPEEPA